MPTLRIALAGLTLSFSLACGGDSSEPAASSAAGASGSSAAGASGASSGGAGASGSGTAGVGGAAAGAAGTGGGTSGSSGAGGAAAGASGASGAAGGGNPHTACTGLPFVASCKMGSACGDYYGAGYTKVALMAGCGAAYSETPCDPTGSVGSCERNVSGNQCGESWYYPPLTASVAMDNCKGTKDMWHPAQ